ncbi:selenium cofactor biosynthesis protein YqeC [Megamonas hypermegale]|uniref:selenium cofactor biosynthesis protein YqeC n=1 Tax=Megamonas hypermegale TaxID=158847 RepID=UPI0026EF1B25|nr:selenium cofactor biosynthesis protein YqeC [Megamonas hypermegale]
MYELYQYINDKLKRSRLTEFLQVKKNDVISFAGAGGKTTTIFALAQELKDTADYKILVTTTTKMMREKEAITVEDEAFIKEQLQTKRLVIAGTDLGRKMGCFAMDFLQRIILLSDITLIEADGAQRRLFKMPRSYEPVYLPCTTKIVYLAGMMALGQKIEDLSRSDIMADFLHKQPVEKLTAEDMVKILQSEQGAKKDVQHRDFYVILNQADDEKNLRSAVQIAAELDKSGIKTAVSRHY